MLGGVLLLGSMVTLGLERLLALSQPTTYRKVVAHEQLPLGSGSASFSGHLPHPGLVLRHRQLPQAAQLHPQRHSHPRSQTIQLVLLLHQRGDPGGYLR